ncbi:peptide chain release factor N(5)-glutamine methyltransferase [Methylosinus sp. Sm6]|uniref:peptide chain release factor N(5)-glutamine methyltransferase n=1 Tax=Methylosinus sp. Sm6 TaxID=2866948 RepID=UPI001C99464E|nr:peptide chain release factor N(5)-glutamine methyltransferase [Methylosinus sp. Sm6]MBY6242189.1 peptide chain release factor N(5)-glutamine methyltransferase [Methylosinus sp. Sm6]
MDGALLAPEETRAEALGRVAALLERSGVEEPRRDARALLLAAGELTPADLLLEPSALLSPEARRRLDRFARRRAAREPVSRILGARGFWTQDLVVAPDVLDPRADTETLVALALDLIGARRGEALTILDLGVGSGAIVCALLSELPLARAVAVDLSPSACAAASTNFARCGLDSRAMILRGRWAEALDARFDLVVSNPPYVASGEIATLAPEVTLHDPALALDGGVDGLARYREIIDDLPRLMAPRSFAVLEAGAGQAPTIAALLVAAGLEIAEIRKDFSGCERAIGARRRD